MRSLIHLAISAYLASADLRGGATLLPNDSHDGRIWYSLTNRTIHQFRAIQELPIPNGLAMERQCEIIQSVFGGKPLFFELEAIDRIARSDGISTPALMMVLTNEATPDMAKLRIVLTLGRRGNAASNAIPTLKRLVRMLPEGAHLHSALTISIASIGSERDTLVSALSDRMKDQQILQSLSAVGFVGGRDWMTDSEIVKVVKQLDSDNSEITAQAAMILGTLGPRAKRVQNSVDSSIRRWALNAKSRASRLIFGMAYAAIVTNEQPSIVRQTLSRFGEEELGHTDWAGVYWIAGSLVDGKMYDWLQASLDGSEDGATIAACRILEAMGLRANSSKKQLRTLLTSNRVRNVRRAAASALGSVLLIEERKWLSEALESEEDEVVRNELVRSLQRIALGE